MELLKRFNPTLRVIMEMGIILALGYWGQSLGHGTGMKILWSLVAPAIGFGFWALVDFRNAGSMAEWLRLIEELVISFLAAFLLYRIGAYPLAWMLFAISIIHHALVYLLGERLLKPIPAEDNMKPKEN